MESLEDKTILVTGGAGFIGSHLVDRLVSEKVAGLIVVDNFFLGKTENLRDAKKRFPALKVYARDVANYPAMKEVFTENAIDGVFNLAVLPLPMSLVKPEYVFHKNTKMTETICRLGREDRYKTLVHFSSSEVYGSALYEPMDEKHHLGALTPYAASKAACDLLVQSYRATFNLDTTILRPFNNYGPRQNDKSYAGVIPLTIKRILSGEPPVIYGTGLQTRDYVYVTETADAAVAAYKETSTRGRTLNVGSGKPTTIKHLITLIAKYMNFQMPIRYAEARPGDVMQHVADVSRARELLGFKPHVTLEDGLRKTVAWYTNPKIQKLYEIEKET